MTHRKERTSRRKSDPGTLSYRPMSEKTVWACELPWGAPKYVPATLLDHELPPGIFAAQAVLVDLFAVFDRKLNSVIEDEEQADKLINKALQRGEDSYMDNLIKTLYDISEVCLPSVLKACFAWYERREKEIMEKINPANENRFRLQKKLMAANFLLCLVLIEILPQAEFHQSMCGESHINYILNLSFRNVTYKDPLTLGVNHANSLILAETYAEVLGVLSLNYFSQIHSAFFVQLNDLKKDTSSTMAVNNLIALLTSMKFLKIKTNQVTEFEVGIRFLDELGNFFLEVKDKDVKHAAAGLLVEILAPVASQIKRETNIPALIAFVQKLYVPTNDLVGKKPHRMAAFPLLTCLLCVSQRTFFLQNWGSFLTATLANLKNRDTKISRVALESLFRLIWVYMIRIGGDGNTSTRSRLESICNSLFPKGNRPVTPRDAPINIFVKIIQFIAQVKLDFAFREIIFELLGANRQNRSLYPERMNIGIRALMVIADHLQQKEEPPGMPKTTGTPASGTMARVKKKTYITRPLTADTAKSIGLEQYYAPCRRAFDSILRILDQQVGKSLMLNSVQARGKEVEELTGGDAKPKLDLLRTCVAAIPRLLPDPMTPIDLVDMLTRIAVHIDDELRELAAQTLQNLVAEFPDWREHVVHAALNLIIHQLSDTYPSVLDIALRLLIQIVTTWRSAAQVEKKKYEEAVEEARKNGTSVAPAPLYTVNYPGVLHSIEGFALVMLCQSRPQPRRVAVQIMKECKIIFETLPPDVPYDTPVITVLDEATPYVVKKYIEHVPVYDKECWTMDLATVCDKVGSLDPEGSNMLSVLVNQDRGNEYLQWDPWACALSGYAEHRFLIRRCPSAVAAAWPILFQRFNAVCGYVDPSNPQNESRASLLRGSKSKGSHICGEALNHNSCLHLWQKYLVLVCAFLPPTGGYTSSLPSRSFSPPSSITSALDSVSYRMLRTAPVPSSSTSILFAKVMSMLRWETHDMRDSVVLGVGSMNAHVFDTFVDDMHSRAVLREACEKKPESNARRRRRRDLLRLQIIRIIEVAVFRGALDVAMTDKEGHLNGHVAEFVDAMRQSLETDQDRDVQLVASLRLHLAKLVALIVDSVAPDARANLFTDERKQHLFYLFINWCGRSIDRPVGVASGPSRDLEVGSFVEQKAVVAMSRLLCCGPIFEANKAIGEEGYLYGWLEKVVSSHNQIMEAEAEETLACMLEMNECSNLLDWLLAQCYRQSARVGARCFRALLRVFSNRELSCEFVALFVLCQCMAADPSIADPAVQMVELLRKRFLDGPATSPLAASSLSVGLRPALSSLTKANDDGCLPSEQIAMCRRLAKAHPQLTITVFSEVCSRLDGAQWHCRAALLALLLPWMENLELVDPMAGEEDACEGPRGWGSEEATQLLLNNLMYLSITQAEQHWRPLADLWRALAVAFPANLPAIINHLYVMTVLSQDMLQPHTKRICVWISSGGGAGPRLASLLIDQLGGNGEGGATRALPLERCEMPPFYRWRRQEVHGHETLRAKGTIVERERVEGVDGDAKSTVSAPLQTPLDEDASCEGVRELPMPAYGGHYSPLNRHLPAATQPILHSSKSQVSLLLLCDVIRAAPEIDWAEATPRLMQASILSLDSRLLCRHARQTIINLCMLHAEKSSLSNVSSLLLNNTMTRSESSRDQDLYTHLQSPSASPSPANPNSSFTRMTHEEYRQMLLHSNALFSNPSDLLNAIVFCLSENMDRPLWAYETTSTRQWKIASAAQLTCLVRHLAELLLPSMPLLPVVWTQIAMRQALSVPDRHVAGRCFQISAALCQPPGAWVPSLLTRLVETAGESADETQAYVTDLMMCLIASVQHIAPPPPEPLLPSAPISAVSPTHIRSTSYTPALLRQSVISSRIHHERKDARFSMLVPEEAWVGAAACLARSKSAEALSGDADAEEEAAGTRALLAAICIALLDSGIDNEFLLAANLLEKLLETAADPAKTAFLQKLKKTTTECEWKGFHGIVALVTRGTVISGAYEQCVSVLLLLADVISEPVVGGLAALGLLTAALLPYLYIHFDSPNALALRAAHTMKQVCTTLALKTSGGAEAAMESPFTHAATMFSQYESASFSKDRLQWAKCVVKYVGEGAAPPPAPTLALLSEMLERGPPSTHPCALHLQYVLLETRDSRLEEREGDDATDKGGTDSFGPLSINAQVVRAVSRHVQGPQWHEAARVLKVLVARWQDTETVSFEMASSLLASSVPRASPPSPRKTPLASADGVANAAPNGATTALRRPPPHVRVRDRLVGLVAASGLALRAGAIPSATSVVFSPSEMGSSAASSTERICPSVDAGGASTTTSIPDPSIGDSFPRVFKEFDFLEAEHDSVSETADSCFGWLSTMRTHSIVEGRDGREEEEEADDDENDEASVGSRPEEEYQEGGRASSARSRASTDRTPCASEVDDDEMDKLSSELDGMSGAGRSERSDVLLHDDLGVCCGSLSSLLRDASHAFSSVRLARAFSRAHDDVTRVADCPYIFVTSHFLRSSPVLQRLKLSLCELVGHLETFAERKEKAMRALSGVKCAQKLSAIGGSMGTVAGSGAISTVQGEALLASSLHKLFFQLMLMSDTFSDMLRNIRESPGAQDLSLSPGVLILQRELLCATASDSSTGSVYGGSLGGTVTSLSSVQSMGAAEGHQSDALFLLLANKQHAQAIATLRNIRQSISSAAYGCCEQVDVDVLLLLHCRSYNNIRAWSVVGADEGVLKDHCDLLRDGNAELAAAVRKASAETAGGGGVMTPRASTVSSLADTSSIGATSSSYVKSFGNPDS